MLGQTRAAGLVAERLQQAAQLVARAERPLRSGARPRRGGVQAIEPGRPSAASPRVPPATACARSSLAGRRLAERRRPMAPPASGSGRTFSRHRSTSARTCDLALPLLLERRTGPTATDGTSRRGRAAIASSSARSDAVAAAACRNGPGRRPAASICAAAARRRVDVLPESTPAARPSPDRRSTTGCRRPAAAPPVSSAPMVASTRSSTASAAWLRSARFGPTGSPWSSTSGCCRRRLIGVAAAAPASPRPRRRSPCERRTQQRRPGAPGRSCRRCAPSRSISRSVASLSHSSHWASTVGGRGTPSSAASRHGLS